MVAATEDLEESTRRGVILELAASKNKVWALILIYLTEAQFEIQQSIAFL